MKKGEIFMKSIFFTIITALILSCSAFGQMSSKTVTADKIIEQIEKGKKISYENVSITGDLDLSNLSERKNDATYPENGKTARVYTATIKQPISFKNVTFTGKLDFFRKVESETEIKEYRLAFLNEIIFENCTFKDAVDFELTNFDGGVSFESSTFKTQPIFVRIGLQKTPNFTKTFFENGSLFKNFQSDEAQNLTAEQLSKFYNDYLTSK